MRRRNTGLCMLEGLKGYLQSHALQDEWSERKRSDHVASHHHTDHHQNEGRGGVGGGERDPGTC